MKEEKKKAGNPNKGISDEMKYMVMQVWNSNDSPFGATAKIFKLRVS